jgi:DNA-binding PadR family transcriptional regulator
MAFQDVQPRQPEDPRGYGRGLRRHRHQGHEQGCGRHGRRAAAGLDEADLRLVIMALLAAQPRTGFETMRALEDRIGSAPGSGPALVYPNLMLLEETGLIAAATDPAGRKVYTLIREGLAALAKNERRAETILADVTDIDPDGRSRGFGRAAAEATAPERRHRCCRHNDAAGATV